MFYIAKRDDEVGTGSEGRPTCSSLTGYKEQE